MRVSSLLFLLLSALVVSAASRTLLNGVSHASEGDQEEEHQRILAELEEVHQLRERMLQQGMSALLLLLARPPLFSYSCPLYNVSSCVSINVLQRTLLCCESIQLSPSIRHVP